MYIVFLKMNINLFQDNCKPSLVCNNIISQFTSAKLSWVSLFQMINIHCIYTKSMKRMVLFVCHKTIVKNLTKFSHMQLKMCYSIALHHTKKNASFTDLLLYCIVHKLHPCPFPNTVDKCIYIITNKYWKVFNSITQTQKGLYVMNMHVLKVHVKIILEYGTFHIFSEWSKTGTC